MHPVLRLYEDTLAGVGSLELPLPALPRFIFVVHGSAEIGGKTVKAGEGWQSEDKATLVPGPEGVTCWRWELSRGDAGAAVANAPGMVTHEKLSAFLETLPKGELLMRADSVSFPPGAWAYAHVHQGPGIRCLLEGGMRIDGHGRSTSYGPGAAWYEPGPEAVFAQGADDKVTRFIRVMILPRALLGQSSIRYVNDDDRAQPKLQTTTVFADAPISFEAKK